MKQRQEKDDKSMNRFLLINETRSERDDKKDYSSVR